MVADDASCIHDMGCILAFSVQRLLNKMGWIFNGYQTFFPSKKHFFIKGKKLLKYEKLSNEEEENCNRKKNTAEARSNVGLVHNWYWSGRIKLSYHTCETRWLVRKNKWWCRWKLLIWRKKNNEKQVILIYWKKIKNLNKKLINRLF